MNNHRFEHAPASDVVKVSGATPVSFVDLCVEHHLTKRAPWWLVGAIFAAVLAVGIFLAASGGPVTPVPITLCGIAVGVVIALYTRSRNQRQREFAAQLAAENAGLPDRELLERFIASAGGFRVSVGILALMRQCVARGHLGRAFRVGPAKDAVAIEPIVVPFEPCPLDEAEDALVDLDAYTRASAAPTSVATERRCDEATKGGSPKSNRPPVYAQDRAIGADSLNTADTAVAPGHHGDDRAAAPSERRALRRIRRNMRLKGVGWAIIALFAINSVIGALVSWRSWTVTWEVLYWPALIVLMLWVPAGGGLIRGKQWFAVPGGLVLRKGHVLARRWHVHVFGGGDSVLCVYRNYREQWAFAVADGVTSATGFGTHRETTLLLRAWLSPLEPPGVERLSDLQ